MDLNQKSPTQEAIHGFDKRRNIVVAGNMEETFKFCVEHFISTANKAIQDHGSFFVALSGGSTPKGIFNRLATPENRARVQWNKLQVFWSDERAVSPDHQDSNYKMAMDSGLSALGIPLENIHRMVAESAIEDNALAYENLIQEKIPGAKFDLIMLGMGDDGHTASLFPYTHALHSADRLVVENYIDSQKVWRMSLTFKCINQAKLVAIYVIGKSKSTTLKRVLEGPYIPDELPSQRVGTLERHALWIVDNNAASDLDLSILI